MKKIGGSRIVLIVYVIFLAVVYVLVRKDIAGETLKNIAFSWQLLLLALGLAKLFTRPRTMGIILTFLGAFTMLPLFTDIFPGLADFVSNRSFWIAVPVFVGIVLLISEILRYRKAKASATSPEVPVATGLSHDGNFHLKTSFGSDTCVVEGGEMSGGDISVCFGSADVNLGRCVLSEGLSVLTVKITMGSLKIVVPSDWYVEVESSSVMGGVQDVRKSKSSDPSKTLLIRAEVSLGSIELSDIK